MAKQEGKYESENEVPMSMNEINILKDKLAQKMGSISIHYMSVPIWDTGIFSSLVVLITMKFIPSGVLM